MRSSYGIAFASLAFTTVAVFGSGGDVTAGGGPDAAVPTGDSEVALVFVSRQINDSGSVYWDEVNDMPGVGAHSRVRPASPGKLLVREADGTIRTLIDGASPSGATLNLVDVNGPAVSYDGQSIVFAGLVQGDYDRSPARSLGAWRLFVIDADGSNLRQLTTSDQSLSLSQFGQAAGGLEGYDDFDPVFLPDGRIAFASTRWPSYGQYSGVRASNIYVVNADGSGMHRITAERNGADRPLVDPLTGKIVYSRWWRNHRFPVDSMDTELEDPNNPEAGYVQHMGLTTERQNPVGGGSMFRNAWQIATIAPDGTGLAMWSGVARDEEANHHYGGSFSSDGVLYANYFPMFNMTEAAGFGGIRRYQRGPTPYQAVAGITELTLEYVSETDPTSYGIFHGVYYSEPEVLPDGRLVVSVAQDIHQDYALYVMNADGSEQELLYDLPGTSELRTRVLAPRDVPPVLDDVYRDDPGSATVASLLPPTAEGPYDVDGTFSFAALNIYANGPVDSEIISAPAVGSASTIRFFIDHQRESPGSFPMLDWPILLGEAPIAADGSVRDDNAPAFVPLFEQLRAADGTVPLTGGPNPNGAAHVAGMNFGAPGAVARCVGCHAGHTQIAVPESDEEALWSNLAPGASVSVSSSRDAQFDTGLIDRRVLTGPVWRSSWVSAPNEQESQWVTLTFPVPVAVRTVRLYDPRPGDEASSSVHVASATVRLFSDSAGTVEVAATTASDLSVEGTDVSFAEPVARMVRIELDEVTGTFYGAPSAALAEVEIIAKGAE